ncbi:MAG TPA: hypothetical protein PLY87_30285 [Planctomycetaceae bacterium]|nr:hypothetical protein [Planctomycetaceae bacterium]
MAIHALQLLVYVLRFLVSYAFLMVCFFSVFSALALLGILDVPEMNPGFLPGVSRIASLRISLFAASVSFALARLIEPPCKSAARSE